MSKIMHQMVTMTKTGAKIRRTIDHSPQFDAEAADDSPTGRIPPGGFLTG